jgi:hypothetical protein
VSIPNRKSSGISNKQVEGTRGKKGLAKGRKPLVRSVPIRNTGWTLTETPKADHLLELVTIAAVRQIMGHDDGVVAVQVQFLVDRHHAVPAPSVHGLHTFSGGLPEVHDNL